MTRALILGGLLAVLVGCAACDNTLDAFEEGGVPFGVYGYLDTSADTQRVRIAPVAPLAPFDTSRIRVVLRDETEGAETRWQPRVVRLADGTDALVYEAAQVVQPGHAYTLRIALDREERTVAAVLVPRRRAGRFAPVERDTLQRTFLPLLLEGPPTPPTRIQVTYIVEAPSVDSLAFPVLYAGGREAGQGYLYRLQVDRDREALLSALGRPVNDTLVLRALRVDLRDDASPLSGSNVTGGVGTFAAVSFSSDRFVLPDSVLRRVGFRAPDAAAGPR